MCSICQFSLYSKFSYKTFMLSASLVIYICSMWHLSLLGTKMTKIPWATWHFKLCNFQSPNTIFINPPSTHPFQSPSTFRCVGKLEKQRVYWKVINIQLIQAKALWWRLCSRTLLRSIAPELTLPCNFTIHHETSRGFAPTLLQNPHH